MIVVAVGSWIVEVKMCQSAQRVHMDLSACLPVLVEALGDKMHSLPAL